MKGGRKLCSLTSQRPGKTTKSAIAAAALGAACSGAGPVAPAGSAAPVISIAIYRRDGVDGYAVVDDRRWIDVAGGALEIDRVDPRADLPSLVIEPLAGGALQIGACLRDRLPRAAFAPLLRCAALGAPGRHLVRALYVVPGLGYRAQHDVAMTAAGQAAVVSRFAVVTPAWQVRAELALFDGTPGGPHPAREVVRGTAMLDGGIAVLAAVQAASQK